MSIYKEFEKLVEKRKKINVDIDYETDPIIKEMVSLMTADITLPCFCIGFTMYWSIVISIHYHLFSGPMIMGCIFITPHLKIIIMYVN